MSSMTMELRVKQEVRIENGLLGEKRTTTNIIEQKWIVDGKEVWLPLPVVVEEMRV